MTKEPTNPIQIRASFNSLDFYQKLSSIHNTPMYRRPAGSTTTGTNDPTQTTPTVNTATISSLTIESGNYHSLSNGNKDKVPADQQLSSSSVRTSFPKRRRRRKTTAFSTHYGSKWFEDKVLVCMAGIFVVLVILVVAGLVVVFRLLSERNVSSVEEPHHEEEEEHHGFVDLKASKVYHIPNSMSHIGDKSDEYARLRQQIEEIYPYQPERSLDATERLRKYDFAAVPNGQYDVLDCPEFPPPNYPYEWNTQTILNHWEPDDASIPIKQEIYQGLCVFDYRRDYVKALNYRANEVPFVVRGDPDVAAAAERWNSPGYMEQLMGDVMHRAEYSESNHFMYWTVGNHQGKLKKKKNTKPDGWKAPTKLIHMTYQEWLEKANVTEDSLLGPDQPHWYFRLIGCGETGPEGECDEGSSEYLFDELTFFQPRPDMLYLVDPHKQKGIHCRFGMKGVIAENHFDGSRNSIVVLGGERRYILSHPEQCPNLALFPKGHPSARHSAVDWSDPDLDEYPDFANAMVSSEVSSELDYLLSLTFLFPYKSNEVVLQAGEVLYLPTSWFHYIISLSTNFQCNTRSGIGREYKRVLRDCGF